MDTLALIKEYATPAAIVAILGFVGNEVWTGFTDHKKKVFEKLDELQKEKQEKKDCGEKMSTHLKESHHV